MFCLSLNFLGLKKQGVGEGIEISFIIYIPTTNASQLWQLGGFLACPCTPLDHTPLSTLLSLKSLPSSQVPTSELD